MGRLLLALLAAALVVAGPAQAKGPHAILTPGDGPAEAGRPWEATLEVVELGRLSHVGLFARRGTRDVSAELRRVWADADQGAARYEVRLTLPAEGRWSLVAHGGKRRFEFQPVLVGSGRMPEEYTAFAGQPYARSTPLPPEEVVVASDKDDGGGPPFWVFPLAGVVLAGAGVLRLRSR
jgi:hypothetical protein